MQSTLAKATFRLAITTFIGVAVVCYTTASGYRADKNIANSNLSTIGLIVGLIIAMSGIIGFPFKNTAMKVIGYILLGAGLCATVFFASMMTACSFGDCI